MDEAISHKDLNTYYRLLVSFIDTASSLLIKNWDEIPWYEVISAYSEVVILNSPTIKFPVLFGEESKNEKMPWEYTGRSWYFWLHLFASNYGWSEEHIGELDIDTAIGLYQEILLGDQLDREWHYGLSEVAYQYNSGTKKNEYKPLDRPTWMLPMAPKQLPVVKIRKDLMPIGQATEPKRKK